MKRDLELIRELVLKPEKFPVGPGDNVAGQNRLARCRPCERTSYSSNAVPVTFGEKHGGRRTVQG
jgi:hypothetical protein